MPYIPSAKKMVPVEEMRKLTRGSYEHLSLRIDDAIAEAWQMFADNEDIEVARVATFSDRIVVGTAEGKYYSVEYQDDGQIKLIKAEAVDVPLVDQSNSAEYVNKFVMDTVNSLLSGSAEVQKESILALMNLKESIEQEDGKDLSTLVLDIITNISPWKAAYRQNIENIKSQVADLAEDLDLDPPEVKYSPLYNGTIPEEKFHLYLDTARHDLSGLESRLAKTESRIESAYLPFAEALEKQQFDNNELDTVREFAVFSESCMKEVHDLREHVKIAIENEHCAMCLGQIHDAIAESLSEYEIASLFINKMALRLVA